MRDVESITDRRPVRYLIRQSCSGQHNGGGGGGGVQVSESCGT